MADNENIRGHLSVGRNVTVGGRAIVRGDAQIDHNLKVEGWLEADNIKDNNKGVFGSPSALQAAYPSPLAGWYAWVYSTEGGAHIQMYRVENGVWQDAGCEYNGATDYPEKADKVSGATEGNFAALNDDGNLLDSGMKPSDFALDGQVVKTVQQNLSDGQKEQARENIGAASESELETFMSDYRPIEIHGDVTNAADEEDLTSVNIGGSDVLRLKDKAYAPSVYSGMGRKILRKNVQTIGGVTANYLMQSDLTEANTVYVVRYDYNLNNQTITIPANSTLVFEGGSLSNGTLVGNNTQIQSADNVIFTSIVIGGTWIVPNITTTWFGDVAQDNKLREVFALQNENIFNTITIGQGDYTVSVNENEGSAIEIKANTKVNNLGHIILSSNNFERCSIFLIASDNVSFSGGHVTGDVDTHSGSTGEWGMGFSVTNAASDVQIESVEIDKCWGDGIYIAGDSKHVTVNYCNIHDCRRQGISVIQAVDVIIHGCNIQDINGTAPRSCIDIEPNSNKTVEKVSITHCTFSNPGYRILILSSLNDTKKINNVLIEGNTFGDSARAIDMHNKSNTITNISNVTIRSNRLESVPSKGFLMWGVYNLDVSFNNIICELEGEEPSTTDGVVYFHDCQNAYFQNNNVDSWDNFLKVIGTAPITRDNNIEIHNTLSVGRYTNFENNTLTLHKVLKIEGTFRNNVIIAEEDFSDDNNRMLQLYENGHLENNIIKFRSDEIEQPVYCRAENIIKDNLFVGDVAGLTFEYLIFLHSDASELYAENNQVENITLTKGLIRNPHQKVRTNNTNLDRIILDKNLKTIDGVTTSYLEQSMLTTTDTVYVVQYDYNLNNQTVTIPANSTLVFEGGSMRNGTLVGDGTQIVASKTSIFDDIVISGTWNVPDITSAWFKKAEDENVLKNVFALQNADIKNRIVVEKGYYSVSVANEGETALVCKSNLELYIIGNITMEPNAFESYIVVGCKNVDNVLISGSGYISGDNKGPLDPGRHTGETGEWGFGISVTGSSRFVTINEVTVKDCWGDCIYVGGSNIKNISIDSVHLTNGRRQGISVTGGDNISITNSRIDNISGTNPQAAIDIEPNSGKSVSNIYICNNYVEDCIVGIVIYKTGSYSKESIVIDNCTIKCVTRAIALNGISTSVTCSNNHIETLYNAIYCNTIDGKQDNTMLFVNNMIFQTEIPSAEDDTEHGTRYAERKFAIYALKGNYEFQHNLIETKLPVFYCGGGAKRIIENNITCPTLFYRYRFNGCSIVGNVIEGNISIPGSDTVIDRNKITGMIETVPAIVYTEVANTTGKNPQEEGWYEFDGETYTLTTDTVPDDEKTYYKATTNHDALSRITNNVILNPNTDYIKIVDTVDKNPQDEGWYEEDDGVYTLTEDTVPVEDKTYYRVSTDEDFRFESIDELFVTNNRFRNIAFKLNDSGIFSNNEVVFNEGFKTTGQLLNMGNYTFSNNTVKYEGTAPEGSNVFVVRARTITSNIISSSAKLRCVFYSGGSSYIAGNILSFTGEQQPDYIARPDSSSSLDDFLQPFARNVGSSANRPSDLTSDKYYVGFRYFDTTLGKPIFWDGIQWVDSTGTAVTQ